MTTENYDTFLPSIFFKSIRIIRRAIFGAKYYKIKSCLIWENFSIFLPDTLSKKWQSLNQIEQLFIKIKFSSQF